MKIKGFFGNFDAPYIRAELICESLNIKEHIDFLVDTGASNIIISDKDADYLKIDYNRIEKLERGIFGIGGEVDTYLLKNVKLIFKTIDGMHTEKLEEIFVTKHQPKTIAEEKRIKCIPSILGRNLLYKYILIIDHSLGEILLTDKRV